MSICLSGPEVDNRNYNDHSSTLFIEERPLNQSTMISLTSYLALETLYLPLGPRVRDPLHTHLICVASRDLKSLSYACVSSTLAVEPSSQPPCPRSVDLRETDIRQAHGEEPRKPDAAGARMPFSPCRLCHERGKESLLMSARIWTCWCGNRKCGQTTMMTNQSQAWQCC